MSPDPDDRSAKGEAAESPKQVKEHLDREDEQLSELEQHIQEAERKRKETFDPRP